MGRGGEVESFRSSVDPSQFRPTLDHEGDPEGLDRLEQEAMDFHKTVRQAYLDIAKNDPERYVVLDASQDVETVTKQLIDDIDKFLT